MTAPETGTMMDDGQPFETGAMILSPDTTGTAAAPGATPSVDQPLEPYAPDTGGSNNSGDTTGSGGAGGASGGGGG
jgi:hypothetical protein